MKFRTDRFDSSKYIEIYEEPLAKDTFNTKDAPQFILDIILVFQKVYNFQLRKDPSFGLQTIPSWVLEPVMIR